MEKLYKYVKPHQILMLLFDIFVVNGAYYLSLFLHRQFDMNMEMAVFLFRRVPFVTLAYIVLFVIRKLYRNLWKYMGFYELVNATVCSFVATGICWTCDYIGMKIC